jgi:hypothetical protein
MIEHPPCPVIPYSSALFGPERGGRPQDNKHVIQMNEACCVASGWVQCDAASLSGMIGEQTWGANLADP